MEDVIREALCESSGKIFKRNDTILPQEYSSRNINGRELSKFIKMLGEITADHCKTTEILRHSFDYIIRIKLSFVSQTLKEFVIKNIIAWIASSPYPVHCFQWLEYSHVF